MKIITAHDGARHYGDMAKVAGHCAHQQGQALEIIEQKDVKHSKPSLMMQYLKWSLTTIWMDADSMIVGDINSFMFAQHFDIALSVKEPENASKRFGSHLYSGLVVAQNTSPAWNFLKDWEAKMTHKSDQRNLHEVLKPYLDDSIYEKAGEIVQMGDLRVMLLDPNVYVHTKSIHDMVPPAPEAKVIHFKGALHKKWPEYRNFLCSW
jgi:hypothetical protein